MFRVQWRIDVQGIKGMPCPFGFEAPMQSRQQKKKKRDQRHR